MTPSPSVLLTITAACAALGWLTGIVAELVWGNSFVSAGAVLLLALLTLRLHRPQVRAASPAVGGVVRLVRGAA